MSDAKQMLEKIVTAAKQTERAKTYLEIIQWLKLQPGDDFLYAAKRIRSMAGDLIQSVFDSETGDKQQ